MSRYLVTGAAGFIGSHLVEALLDTGEEVVGIDAFTDYYARELKEANLARAKARPRFELLELDLAEADLTQLVDRVDGVFHLAAQPGVRGSWGDTFAVYVRDNVVATQRLLEASARAGIRVVQASSSSVYGNAEAYPTVEDAILRPVSPYGVTKLACERLAGAYSESYGLDVVSLRYFTVYGPRQRPDMAFSRIVSALRSDRPFSVFGTGGQSRDFTFVDDAVAATILAMRGAPASPVYNVGGGSEATLGEVIALCERLSGKRLDLRREPVAPGDVRRTAADTSLIRSELGWRPHTELADGVGAQLAAEIEGRALQRPEDDRAHDAGAQADGDSEESDLAAAAVEEVGEDAVGERRGGQRRD
jgi:nucleoside-diphosphate-sugar epimerase